MFEIPKQNTERLNPLFLTVMYTITALLLDNNNVYLAYDDLIKHLIELFLMDIN